MPCGGAEVWLPGKVCCGFAKVVDGLVASIPGSRWYCLHRPHVAALTHQPRSYSTPFGKPYAAVDMCVYSCQVLQWLGAEHVALSAGFSETYGGVLPQSQGPLVPTELKA